MKVEIKSKLPTNFSREVKEGQVLCPTCGGIGLYCDGNFIRSCRDCGNGVLNVCKFCGEPATYNHKCEGLETDKFKQRHKKYVAQWNKAIKVPLIEAEKQFKWLYVDNYDEYVDFDNIEDWIEEKKYDEEDFDQTELRIYGTSEIRMGLNAYDIIERACEELHEEAFDTFDQAVIKEMQEFLDKFVEKYADGAKSYEADYEYAVILP